MTRPTAERIRELFDYDAERGHLVARVQRSNRIQVGEDAGGLTPKGYIRVRVDGGRYFEHSLVWLHVTGEWPPKLDHRSTEKTDNHFENLRPATQSQNSMNRRRRKDNEVGFKGVMKNKRGRPFRAHIWDGGRRVVIGHYDTPEEAHAAYCAAAHERFGEFANGG